jgi:hypothetical protein
VSAQALAAGADEAPRSPRVLDRGAIVAGWVGVGMALVIAIAFELIIAVQTLVFLAAPLAGIVIGAYANVRSGRWRPRRRVIVNAAWAGIVTGVTLAVLYVAVRLLFVFADAGSMPDGSYLSCRAGPECTYQRYVLEGRADELAAVGVTDGPSFGAYALREQVVGGLVIVGLTVAGALAAGAVRTLRVPPTSAATGSA